MTRKKINILLKQKTISFLVCFFCFFIAHGQDKPVNVLFIAVDDLKPNLNCFGDSLAITPHIDAIAEKGMVFSNTHCQQAVCAPSRASLLTGRYPDQTKVWDLQTLIRDMNPDILTLPQHFKQKGYLTYGNGKIFDPRSVDNNKDTPSWTSYGNPYNNNLYSSIHGKPSYYYAAQSAKDTIAKLEAQAVQQGINKRTYVQKYYWPSVENADVDYNAYVDGAIAKSSISLMQQAANSNKPFFLAVGFQRPHLPFNAPKNFWDLYQREDFKLATFRQQASNSPSIAYHNYNELRSYTDIPNSGNIPEAKQLELIHAYYAAISYIDHLVGMLTNKLDDLGLAENTVIVLWGDHGWHLGDHNLWCKHSNFEEATRSPLIISYPGQEIQGVTYAHPTEFTDIATTLCELTGLEVPLDFEGKSLIPAMQNPDLQIREGALSQYPRNSYMGYSLRTNRYRYTKWVNKSNFSHYTAELYDYDTDPLETINFVQDPAYRDIKNRLDSIVQARIQIPSTQKKITIKVQAIQNNDTLNIKNADIDFANNRLKSNNSGEVFFTHVPGTYPITVNAPGFHESKIESQLNSDTVLAVFLTSKIFNVNFKVNRNWNNQPIENAEVLFYEKIQFTDATGNVNYTAIPYNIYDVQVKQGNEWIQFQDIEIYSDTTILLSIIEPTNEVQIIAENLYNRDLIYETSVTIEGTVKTTNSSGQVFFELPKSKYKVILDHPNYKMLTDSIEVRSDTIFRYGLSPEISTIKIKLKENTTPVNKAKITIDNDIQETNGLGNAFFRAYQTFQTYSYKIEKDKYKTVEGELFLINDTTITIQMEKVPTSANSNQADRFAFWPNPFESKIQFKNYSSSPYSIQIQNITGKLISELILSEGESFALDTSQFRKGIYLLSFKNKRDRKVFKIIKT